MILQIAAADGKADWLPLELADFDSVRDCARRFLALDRLLHLLVNNAGLAGVRGLTKSGFELAFGVNHMGHFLLTQLLQDRLRQSAPARIVTVASRAHRRAGVIASDIWRGVPGPLRALLRLGCVQTWQQRLGDRS